MEFSIVRWPFYPRTKTCLSMGLDLCYQVEAISHSWPGCSCQYQLPLLHELSYILHLQHWNLPWVNPWNFWSWWNGSNQEEAGLPTHSTDSFPQCSRLKQVKKLCLDQFLPQNILWWLYVVQSLLQELWWLLLVSAMFGWEKNESTTRRWLRWGSSLMQHQELGLPFLSGDLFSLGFKPRISTTQRKAVIKSQNMHPSVHPLIPWKM